jgi:4-amino-4-deoxy-L-arabinose transferase-like glycosyltransferase
VLSKLSAAWREPDAAAAGLPARPRLLPISRLARIALVLVLAFTLARGAMWAMTTPNFWGPDEDYHMMYVDTVGHDHRLITPSKPLYSNEYSRTTDWTFFNVYGQGARFDYRGDPKASLHRLARLPETQRAKVATGRGIGVVHAPLYYVVGGAVDFALGPKAMPTRLFWVRMVSGVFGVLAVYATWLIASMFFAAEAAALAAAVIVALQPIFGYMSGLVNNDTAVMATSVLALAMCVFLVRTRPRVRQGMWLGLALSLALATKSTALAMLPVAGFAYLLQGMAYGRWRVVLRSMAWAAGLTLVLIGWWYIRSRVLWGTFTGEVHGYHGIGQTPPAPVPDPAASVGAAQSAAPAAPQAPQVGIKDYLTAARQWLATTYRTFWFHFLEYEAPRGTYRYFVPGFVSAVGGLAYISFLLGRLRTWRLPDKPLLRMSLVAAAPLVTFIGPLLALDVRRRVDDGSGFLQSAGRFGLPAYPGLVICAMLGVFWLVRRRHQRGVVAILVLGAGWQCWTAYRNHYMGRYFGTFDLNTAFHRMAFDRPEFVTAGFLWALFVAIVLLAVAIMATLWTVSRREDPDRPVPVEGGEPDVGTQGRRRLRLPWQGRTTPLPSA